MRIQKSTMRSRNASIHADTDIAEEAADLLFETDDVAELLSQVTGEDIDVTADGDVVEFGVGDESYTCSAEPGDETVESSTRTRARRRVSAASGRRVAASTGRRPAGRTVRRVPRYK